MTAECIPTGTRSIVNKTVQCFFDYSDDQYRLLGDSFDCAGACNCKDRTEVCDRVNGSCPVSGCADWYVGTGCDHALPRLGNTVAPDMIHDGRTVTVQLTLTQDKNIRNGTAAEVELQTQLLRLQWVWR